MMVYCFQKFRLRSITNFFNLCVISILASGHLKLLKINVLKVIYFHQSVYEFSETVGIRKYKIVQNSYLSAAQYFHCSLEQL